MSELSYAMAAYRSQNTDENLGKLYNEISCATYHLTIGQVNESTIHFDLMKNGNGDRYLLAFSSLSEVTDFFGKEKKALSFGLSELIDLIKKDASLCGILVDPKSGNMVFDKELLESIYESVKESLS